MAKFEDGCYGSLKGIALIAKVLAGRGSIHYTRVAVGKGEIPDNKTPKTLTEPPEYVMDAIINSVTNPVNGECQVSVQINSAYVEYGFYARWLILYAKDPDEGEIPFTVLCLENEPEWIRPSSSIVGKLAHFDIIAAVGDVDKVTATIDPDALLTYGDVNAIIENIAIRRLDVTIPVSGWVSGTGVGYAVQCDIPVPSAAERMIPFLTVLPGGMASADACGLAPFTETREGVLRVFARKAPTTAIPASLALAGDTSGFFVVGEESYVLPPATADALGGVMIGGGVDVEDNGRISVDGARIVESAAASEESARLLLDEVFGTP